MQEAPGTQPDLKQEEHKKEQEPEANEEYQMPDDDYEDDLWVVRIRYYKSKLEKTTTYAERQSFSYLFGQYYFKQKINK